MVRLGGLLTLNVFSANEQFRAEITSCPEMKSICHSIFQIFSIQRSVGDWRCELHFAETYFQKSFFKTTMMRLA